MIGPLSGSAIGGAPAIGRSASLASTVPVNRDFSSILGEFVSSTIDTLRQSEAAAAQGIIGTMPAQQVVESIMAAERSLQTVLAVRDKLVGAYLEISRMQI